MTDVIEINPYENDKKRAFFLQTRVFLPLKRRESDGNSNDVKTDMDSSDDSE